MAPNKEEILAVVCEEKVSFVTLGAGNPVPFFEKLKNSGVKVIPVVKNKMSVKSI